MIRRRAIGVVTALWLALAVWPAAAQEAAPEDAPTRAAHERGLALVLDGRYREALAEFSAGYDVSRRPLFLFNMAECARKLGELARARELYEQYLREDPSGRLADTAKQRLGELPPPAPTLAPARAVELAAPERVAPTTLVVTRHESAAPQRPFWRKWPFWAGVGAAVAVGTAAVFVLHTTDDCGNCVDLRDP